MLSPAPAQVSPAMLFFKRILGKTELDGPPERRGGARYAVGAEFPVKTSLNTVGRDEIGQPLKSKNGEGWDWAGRVINVSRSGARMQVPPTMHSHKGDPCILKLEIEGYQLAVPGTIVHIQERRDSFIYGLQLRTEDDAIGRPYHQLIELIALGAALKPTQPEALDESSGYLKEQYGGEEFTQLDVWRDAGTRRITAFDFRLRDCRVRGVSGNAAPEYLLNGESGELHAAPPEQRSEIRRLFQWVVPNVSPEVPEDVRAVLREFAV